jgi:O-antigen ligase
MTSEKLHVFSVAAAALLGWGVLAFGSEYSWAYAPLVVFSVVVGVLGCGVSSDARFPARALGVAVVALLVAGLVQLAPMSRPTIASVRPASLADDYGQLYSKMTMQGAETGAATGENIRRPLSIAPTRTVLGLIFLTVLMLLFVGCVRGVSALGSHGLARAILVLGVLVALLELGQKASGSDVVYGFWYPPQLKGYHSAPFVNRNHTAGWLLMALSLSAGYFAGAVGKGLRAVKPDWRHRILWLSSSEATTTVLAGVAIVVMAIAIVITASRSGSSCLVLVIAMFGWWVLRRQSSGSRRVVAAGYLAFVLIAAASWGHVDTVFARFEEAPNDVRPAIWRDTLRIIEDSPLTGTGLNTYGIAMLHYQTVRDGFQYVEAHNDYLQLAAEGGLLLGVPILIALVLFVREVRRRFRDGADDTTTYWLRVGAVIGLCAIAAQETVDFTLQMPGAAVLFVVLAAIAIHRPPQRMRESSIAAVAR